MKPPKPGIYPDVSFEEYRSWDAINNSSLTPLIQQSPQHYLTGLGDTDDAPHLRLGTLCHKARLERRAFLNHYKQIPDDELAKGCKTDKGAIATSPKNTADFKERKVNWLLNNAGIDNATFKEWSKVEAELNWDDAIEWLLARATKQIVSQSDYERAEGVFEALKAHDQARKLIDGCDMKEVSIVARCPNTGLTLKGRIDGLRTKGRRRYILDLKTTRDASQFDWFIWDFQYHRGGAFYQNLVAHHLSGELLDVHLIAVESSKPYGVRAAPVHPDDLAQGRDEYENALRILEALQGLPTDQWHGYESPDYWRLPEPKRRVTIDVEGEALTL